MPKPETIAETRNYCRNSKLLPKPKTIKYLLIILLYFIINLLIRFIVNDFIKKLKFKVITNRSFAEITKIYVQISYFLYLLIIIFRMYSASSMPAIYASSINI